MIVAEQTEKDIDATRSQYIPVAVRTQILFFCTYDLATVDPMYQYSLDWFIRIFLNGIMNAEQAGKKETNLKKKINTSGGAAPIMKELDVFYKTMTEPTLSDII